MEIKYWSANKEPFSRRTSFTNIEKRSWRLSQWKLNLKSSNIVVVSVVLVVSSLDSGIWFNALGLQIHANFKSPEFYYNGNHAVIVFNWCFKLFKKNVYF